MKIRKPTTHAEARELLTEFANYTDLETFAREIGETYNIVNHWLRIARELCGDWQPHAPHDFENEYIPNIKLLFFDLELYMGMIKSMGIWDSIGLDIDKIPPHMIERYKSICMFSFSWWGSGRVFNVSVADDFDRYQADKFDDYHVVKKLWELFEVADIVVAHNGDRFDLTHFNARCGFNGLPLPKNVKMIDTLKIANKVFGRGAMGNSLDNLARFLKVANKGKSPNWEKLSRGDTRELLDAIPYCNNDITTMKAVFFKLWKMGAIKNFNLNPILQDNECCSGCGKHDTLKVIGYDYTAKHAYNLYRCNFCNTQQRGERVKYGKLGK